MKSPRNSANLARLSGAALLVLATGCAYSSGGDPLVGPGGGGGGSGGGAMPVTPDPKARGSWVNVTGSLAGMASECGNISFMSARPDRDMLIAGIALHGLWVNPSGTDWTALGQGAGSAVIDNRARQFIYDPVHPDTFWEVGIYNEGGVYRTDDNGQTFVRVGKIRHNDSLSIDLNDPERKTMLAGGHEMTSLVWLSTDGGKNWNNTGMGIPGGAGYTSSVFLVSPQIFLVGTSTSHEAGVFRTTDGGMTWTKVFGDSGVYTVMAASDGAIYWLLESDRGVIRSTDQGATWTNVGGAGIVTTSKGGASLIELPDGRLVSLGSGSLVASSDKGKTWRALGPGMAIEPWGVLYARYRKAFYLWKGDCNPGIDPVPADAIMKLDFDYLTQ